MPEDSEPGQIPDWRTVLSTCSRETRATARMWLYYTLFYWLIPTAIAVFGLLVGRKQISFTNLIIHGEFLIYAITLTAASTRLVAKDVPNSGPFVNRQAFNLISHVMILPANFVYGLVRYIKPWLHQYIADRWLLRHLTNRGFRLLLRCLYDRRPTRCCTRRNTEKSGVRD